MNFATVVLVALALIVFPALLIGIGACVSLLIALHMMERGRWPDWLVRLSS